MFISKYTGDKKISELERILEFIPRPIFDEIDDLTIVYRGIVQMRGRKGDLLIRVEGDKILNVVWDKNKGEIRQLDRGLLNKYIDSYDELFKDLVVKESSRTLNKMFVINQKVSLVSSSKTKKK
jgi:hypothetical protein